MLAEHLLLAVDGITGQVYDVNGQLPPLAQKQLFKLLKLFITQVRFRHRPVLIGGLGSIL